MNIELLHTDTLTQAREKLKNETKNFELKVHRVACEEALGCICAKDVIAEENVPPFRRSTVDGYAIIAGDSYGAGDSNPAFYQVTGHVNIEEQALMTVDMGEAVQVQTGSMVPDGATAVLMVEYTEQYADGKIIGAKQYDRVKQVTKGFIIGATVLTLIFYIPIQLAPATLLSWFIKDANLVSQGVAPFRILFSTYILLGFLIMAITLMQSLGKASKASVLVMLRQIVLFIPLAIIIPMIGGLGVTGVFMAPALTDLVVVIMAIFMVASVFRDLTKQAAQEK